MTSTRWLNDSDFSPNSRETINMTHRPSRVHHPYHVAITLIMWPSPLSCATNPICNIIFISLSARKVSFPGSSPWLGPFKWLAAPWDCPNVFCVVHVPTAGYNPYQPPLELLIADTTACHLNRRPYQLRCHVYRIWKYLVALSGDYRPQWCQVQN